MTRQFLLFAALLTAGCDAPLQPKDADNEANAGEAETPANASAPPVPPPIPGKPGQAVAPPNPDAPPPTAAEKTPAGAVAVLQAYCDAIAHKDYAAAYRAWGDGGKSTGVSEAGFAANLKKYDAYDCSFSAPLDEEGAAGSTYLTVPAVINGTLARGGGFSLRGPFTMRRVNDVDGATPAQLRWHIEKAELKPGP